MGKRGIDSMEWALSQIKIERLTRNHFMVTFPVMTEDGVLLMANKVTKEQLEQGASALLDIGDMIARAFRSPVPKRSPIHKDIAALLGKPSAKLTRKRKGAN